MEGVVNEIHKPARRNFPRRPFIVKGINESWQSDLVDMQKYSRENKGFRYLLVAIDSFTKYAYVKAIKTKKGEDVTRAFAAILKEHKKAPKNLCVDQGKEYFNKHFQSLMDEKKINLYHTYSENKASIAERFNRTLKQKLWKKFSLNGNYKYLDILPKIVSEYNNTVHRTISMKPKDVTKKNENFLLQTVYNYKNNNNHFKFKVGDFVRISKYKHLFRKSYLPNWTTEVFTIKRRLPTYPPTYLLQDYQNNILEGCFYEEQLQKSVHHKVFPIEKVIKRKGNSLFVKWLGFDSTHNSWIDKSKLEK